MKLIRIYSPLPPNNQNDGALYLISEQIEALRALKYEVEVIHWLDSNHQETRNEKFSRLLKTSLSRTASPEEYHYPLYLNRKVSAKLKEADIGIYHYSFSYNWLKFGQRPEKKIIVHFQNLESQLSKLRKEKALSSNFVQAGLHLLNQKKLERHEKKILQFCDEAWFVSQVDLNAVKSKTEPSARGKLRLVPPSFRPELYQKRLKNFHDVSANHQILGILGRYDFEPNRASLEWIITRLAPALYARAFQGSIHVVGKFIPQDLIDQAQIFPFIHFQGFLPHLEDFWSSLSFLLIPQVGGSGVRIKLLEALASGVPVLANSAAFQPLADPIQKSPLLTVSDDPNAWAEKIMGEKAFHSRRQAISGPEAEKATSARKALEGQQIYDFLSSL